MKIDELQEQLDALRADLDKARAALAWRNDSFNLNRPGPGAASEELQAWEAEGEELARLIDFGAGEVARLSKALGKSRGTADMAARMGITITEAILPEDTRPAALAMAERIRAGLSERASESERRALEGVYAEAERKILKGG